MHYHAVSTACHLVLMAARNIVEINLEYQNSIFNSISVISESKNYQRNDHPLNSAGNRRDVTVQVAETASINAMHGGADEHQK